MASTKVVFPPADHSAIAKQIAAATKNWHFEPFVIRGKPGVACALETAKL